MNKRILLFFLAAVFGFFVFNAPTVQATTADELRILIQQLQQQIAQLQSQLNATQGGEIRWCYVFNANLRIGDSGADVSALQLALKKEGILSQVYSEGEFDEETASAIVEFQEKYKDDILTPVKLKRGNGFVGKLTRAKLNKLYNCGISPFFPVTATTTPSITVTSPNGGEEWAVGETRRVSWNSNGVNNVRIYIENSSVSGSGSTNYIYDGTIPANQGYYDWTIVQNQLPEGNTLPRNYKIRINGVDTPTSGALLTNDLSDNFFTIIASSSQATTTVPVGNITLSKDVVSPASVIVPLGKTGVTLGVWRINQPNNVEDLKLTKIQFFNATTSATSSANVKNLKLYCGGVQLGETVASMNSNSAISDTYWATFAVSEANGCVIPKGGSNQLTLTGDFVDYANSVYQAGGPISSGSDWIQIYAELPSAITGAASEYVVAKGVTSGAYASSTNSSSSANRIYPYRTSLAMSMGCFGSCSGRIRSVVDKVASITLTSANETNVQFKPWPGSNNHIKIHVSGNVANTMVGTPFYLMKSDGTQVATGVLDADGTVTLDPYATNSQPVLIAGSAPQIYDLMTNTQTLLNSDAGTLLNLSINLGTANLPGDVSWHDQGINPSDSITWLNGSSPLSVSLNYSYIATTTPSITVISPNGGEVWAAGQTYEIRWTSQNATSLDMCIRYGPTCYYVVWNAPAASNSIYWTVPVNASYLGRTDLKIQIEDVNNRNNYDQSDNYFSIVGVSTISSRADLAPTYITYPSSIKAGDSVFFDSGIENIGGTDTSVFNIKWFVDDVQTGYGSHSGVSASTTVLNGNSQYTWTAVEGTHTIKFVVDADNHIDESNETNNSRTVTLTIASSTPIVPPSFTVTSPNGGEQWARGESRNITWASTGSSTITRISLYKAGNVVSDSSLLLGMFIAVDVPNTGSYNWNIPSALVTGSQYTVRVWDPYYPNNYDDSDNYFVIIASSSEATTTHLGTCTDSDGSNPDIYGNVSGRISNGTSYTYFDECSGSSLQINERWCYESPEGSGNYVSGVMVYNCANGCNNGACMSASATTSALNIMEDQLASIKQAIQWLFEQIKNR